MQHDYRDEPANYEDAGVVVKVHDEGATLAAGENPALKDIKKLERVPRKLVVYIDKLRYPGGCPDPDWCRGNAVCYWDCREWEGSEL